MRGVFPKKKSILPALGKAIAAAKVLLNFRDDKIDTKEAGLILRREIGLQWTVLTAAQYLTGKEAMQALAGLPADWTDGAWTKQRMMEAVMFANLLCAQAHPNGCSLSAGALVSAFKPDGEIGKILRDFQEAADGTGQGGNAD